MSIATIKGRVAKATLGQWDAFAIGSKGAHVVGDRREMPDGTRVLFPRVARLYDLPVPQATADAEFIAHARTDVELLLAVAEAAKAVKAQCDDMCPRWYDEPCDCGMAALGAALAALEAGA